MWSIRFYAFYTSTRLGFEIQDMIELPKNATLNGQTPHSGDRLSMGGRPASLWSPGSGGEELPLNRTDKQDSR